MPFQNDSCWQPWTTSTVSSISSVNRDRRRGIARTVKIDERPGHPHQFARRRRILQRLMVGWLARPVAPPGSLPSASLNPGSWRSVSRSIGIFIAARDRQHASAQNVAEIMDDAGLVARVGDAGGKALSYPQPLLRLRQQQYPAVRGQPPAIERRGHFLRQIAGNEENAVRYLLPWRAWHFLSGVEGLI